MLQFPKGSANLTYRVTVGDTHLVVRRPPFGSLAPRAHDMGREFRVLYRLHAAYDRAPRAFLHCADPGVVGAEFFVSEYRQGIVAWDHVPAELSTDSDASRRVGLAVIDALADAVITLAQCAAGLMEDRFPPGALWIRAFEATYGAELRAEGNDRARLIYEADRERYDRLAPPALQAAGLDARIAGDGHLSIALSPLARRRAAATWRRRRLLGKLLSVLRLAKGAFTFDGGVSFDPVFHFVPAFTGGQYVPITAAEDPI